MDNIYKEIFIESDELDFKQDFSSFKKYMKNEKYATSFPNLSGDTILIVPINKRGKDFATIKNFIDNASITQQKHFWKLVAKVIREQLKKYNSVYVSSHGLGIHYFHLRVCQNPKYYISDIHTS